MITGKSDPSKENYENLEKLKLQPFCANGDDIIENRLPIISDNLIFPSCRGVVEKLNQRIRDYTDDPIISECYQTYLYLLESLLSYFENQNEGFDFSLLAILETNHQSNLEKISQIKIQLADHNKSEPIKPEKTSEQYNAWREEFIKRSPSKKKDSEREQWEFYRKAISEYKKWLKLQLEIIKTLSDLERDNNQLFIQICYQKCVQKHQETVDLDKQSLISIIIQIKDILRSNY